MEPAALPPIPRCCRRVPSEISFTMAVVIPGRPALTGRTRFPASLPGMVTAPVARGIGLKVQRVLEGLVGLALRRLRRLAPFELCKRSQKFGQLDKIGASNRSFGEARRLLPADPALKLEDTGSEPEQRLIAWCGRRPIPFWFWCGGEIVFGAGRVGRGCLALRLRDDLGHRGA